jgi:ech hydrogenase subunit A
MERYIIDFLVLAPILTGLLAWVARPRHLRTLVITGGALATMGASIGLAVFSSLLEPSQTVFPRQWAQLPQFLEPVLAVAILLIARRIRCWPVVAMAAAQLALIAMGMRLPEAGAHAEPLFQVDPLAITMVLIVSLIGSMITLYAIGYMHKHEEHPHPGGASTGRFFFFLIAFLGLMNGLVLTNNLRWLGIFWEGTTLCSFFLIGSDNTTEAKASARRALLINAMGGLAITLASYATLRTAGHESLGLMLAGVAMLPMTLLAFATMTKSAQLPFQSWLLGAMVAPTPVSALLHSSTMVKAGSYLILRLSPAMAGTPLALVVAIAGGFTFAVCGAMAISQTNGKKVLAYSTIGNLGLIAACAGIGTPLAYAAALMLLVFHALSKALLFLCVGTIEQTIGSRHIEDMGGILFKMPLTTVVAICGMVSMMAPPFGMLIGKWMAIESAAHEPAVLLLFVIGSALTIFFWAKWIGRITTASYHPVYKVERVSRWMIYVLLCMAFAVTACSLVAMPIYHALIKPVSLALFSKHPASVALVQLMNDVDAFVDWPLFVVLGIVLLAAALSAAMTKRRHIALPYLGGENMTGGEWSFEFRSLMDKREMAMLNSYYLSPLFGENTITRWANPVAFLIVLTLLRVGFL